MTGWAATMVDVAEIRTFQTHQAPSELLAEIRSLLLDAFEEFTDDDWTHALGGTHVVAVDGERVVAHAAVVPRVLEVDGVPWTTGYVEAVGVHPTRQGEGLGSLLAAEVADVVRSTYRLGGLCTGVHAFYDGLGWDRWTGPTWVRRDGVDVRTQAEDGTVMVLRFDASATVDPTARISCDDRSGDVW